MARRTPSKRRPTGKRRPELAAAAGSERRAHFAAGGTPVSWNGGRMWTATNGRAKASRDACRGRIGRGGSDDR